MVKILNGPIGGHLLSDHDEMFDEKPVDKNIVILSLYSKLNFKCIFFKFIPTYHYSKYVDR